MPPRTLAAAGVIALVTTAGCGSTTASTSHRVSVTRTATQVVTTTTSPSATAASATTSTAAAATHSVRAAGARTCATRTLHIFVQSLTGTAGTQHAFLAFTNLRPARCSLQDYPGMDLLGGSGHPEHYRVVRGHSSGAATTTRAVRVVLRHGASAYADISWPDQCVSGGATPSRMLVTPPNNRATATISTRSHRQGGRMYVCKHTITTSPVFARFRNP